MLAVAKRPFKAPPPSKHRCLTAHVHGFDVQVNAGIVKGLVEAVGKHAPGVSA